MPTYDTQMGIVVKPDKSAIIRAIWRVEDIMRILITGAGGRLGGYLSRVLLSQGHDIISATHHDLDVTSYPDVRRYWQSAAPELVIHCAALTNVDRCAEFPDEAYLANGLGTKNVALACQYVDAALCYISTNEVFDGEQTTPYLEYDAPRPINPYGYSKWIGEQAVRHHIARHYIVRIAWLFAHNGGNFLQKIVAMAGAGKPLSVVTDEIASPTYLDDLAPALAALVASEQYGTYHLTNAGAASRYEFARHILDCSGFKGYPIQPITLAQFSRPSRPPKYSALRNFMAAHIGITLRPWQEAVADFAAMVR